MQEKRPHLEQAEHPLSMLSNSEGVGPLLPEYMAKFGEPSRAWTARWNKRMADGDRKRTNAALDWDVNITLPRQWALLQPENRLDMQRRIAAPAHTSSAWPSGFAPGQDGIRALVVALLVWGSTAKGQIDEQTEWRLIAADVAQVLRILARQGGAVEHSAPEARKKCVLKTDPSLVSYQVATGCPARRLEKCPIPDRQCKMIDDCGRCLLRPNDDDDMFDARLCEEPSVGEENGGPESAARWFG